MLILQNGASYALYFIISNSSIC